MLFWLAKPTIHGLAFCSSWRLSCLLVNPTTWNTSKSFCTSARSSFHSEGEIARFRSTKGPTLQRMCSKDDADKVVTTTKKGTASFVGIDVFSSGERNTSSNATSILDYLLSLIASDIGSIFLGVIGLIACLANRLLLPVEESTAELVITGEQSRVDLLAVFASIAVLLNGVSNLDVTSAMGDSVELDGVSSEGVQLTDGGLRWLHGALSEGQRAHPEEEILWALGSLLDATPAGTVVFMVRSGKNWIVGASVGVLPVREALRTNIPASVKTPILDRFLGLNGRGKESYLPTLQALPGRVEFTYLPPNTQGALLVPVFRPLEHGEGDGDAAILVLGSNTAKSFTPRDVAWCQVVASRIANIRTI